MESANVTLALNERNDFLTVAQVWFFTVTLALVEMGFINRHDAAIMFAAHFLRRYIVHCLTDAVSHEPGGLVRHPKGAMKLMGAKGLLAGAHKVGRHEPLSQRDFGALKDGSYSHAVLLVAVFALV